mmetsp:Transcript_65249/g.75003  ORF Transcript_65249/g.75003 Transcript_65249/m.75003 type:complete len:83 (-) Transcript_65249:15-263(-)
MLTKIRKKANHKLHWNTKEIALREETSNWLMKVLLPNIKDRKEEEIHLCTNFEPVLFFFESFKHNRVFTSFPEQTKFKISQE